MAENEKLNPMNLVEVRKDIYKMERALADLHGREQDLAGKYGENIATSISNHAIVQFCDRVRPAGFDIDALRLMILEYVSKAKPVKERKGSDQSMEYFYEYNINDSSLIFLVKGGTLVTVWKKDGADV